MTSFSMAKTIVAMLVGIALSEGAIQSLDDRAEKYVPELKGTPYGETSIRHLLTMSSGIRFSETYSGTDDVATLVRLSVLGESDGGAATVMPFRTRERPAGERYHYSSADTQVLGLVLRAATGRPLADYLSEKIWQPMGAEADASWLIDKGGYEIGLRGRQGHRAGLRALRHAARERRRARRPADHPGRMGPRGDDGVREAVRAQADGHDLRLRLPDVDLCPARSGNSCCGGCATRSFSWTRSRSSCWCTRLRATTVQYRVNCWHSGRASSKTLLSDDSVL